MCLPSSKITSACFQQTRLCFFFGGGGGGGGGRGLPAKEKRRVAFFTPLRGQHKRGLFSWATVPLHHLLASRLHAQVLIRLRREKSNKAHVNSDRSVQDTRDGLRHGKLARCPSEDFTMDGLACVELCGVVFLSNADCDACFEQCG